MGSITFGSFDLFFRSNDFPGIVSAHRNVHSHQWLSEFELQLASNIGSCHPALKILLSLQFFLGMILSMERDFKDVMEELQKSVEVP